MTTRYRVEYALKTHRRDQFIEWIKGLLAVPFVLLSQPTATAIDEHDTPAVTAMAHDAHARYSQIMADVERLIDDHIAHPGVSKLKLLVPTVGLFFTPLPLRDAFAYQDRRRHLSHRRFVAPSFNDIRLILNTAQLMALARGPSPPGPRPRLDLVTFDGDVTLYDDGDVIAPSSPCIPRILALLHHDIRVGLVTAAGYTDPAHYHARFRGLLDAMAASPHAATWQDRLVVMGGEANFMFTYHPTAPHRLLPVPTPHWHLPEMTTWTEPDITALLDVAEAALKSCIATLHLPVHVLRKPRAVGIYPAPNLRLAREQLEETVLVVQRTLEGSDAGRKIPFCAFNGGNDVFVDVGDKSWGVRACQRFFGGIAGDRSLHVGDQFLSAGSNDFKARLAATTAWIANPSETCALLDELIEFLGE